MIRIFTTNEKRSKAACLCLTFLLVLSFTTEGTAEILSGEKTETVQTNEQTTTREQNPASESDARNASDTTGSQSTTEEPTTVSESTAEESSDIKEGRSLEKNTTYYIPNGIYEICIRVKNESEANQKFSFQVNGFDPMGRRSIPAGKTKSITYKIAVTEGTIRVAIAPQPGLTVTDIIMGEKQVNPKKNKTAVYFFGDSTARFYYKRKQIGGMGEGFIKTLKEYNQCKITSIKGRYEGMYLASMPSIDVYNYSRCGQSTVSMTQKGTLNEMLCSVSQGDYVIINLGHNDYLHDKVGIYASPAAYRKNLTKIISDIRISGGIPILCSPTAMCTYRYGKTYTKLTGCEKVMKKVADETGTLYLAFGEAHRSYLDAIGESKAKNLYRYRYNGRDITHMNKKGADIAGKILAGLITKCKSLQNINNQIATNYTPMVKAMKSVQNLDTRRYSPVSVKRFRLTCRKQVITTFHQKASSNRVLKSASMIKTAKVRLSSNKITKRKKSSIKRKARTAKTRKTL